MAVVLIGKSYTTSFDQTRSYYLFDGWRLNL